MLISALFIVFILTLPMTLWLFGIRRYCIRNGKGYTPGASWQTTIWIDWQEATELSLVRGDTGMQRLCGAYLIIHLFYTLSLVLVLIGQLLAF